MSIDFKKSISNPIAVDVGNYVTQGRIVSKTVQLSSFTTNENAVWAANIQLQKESFPFAFIDIPVNRVLFRLQVGDCFKFSYAKYGISNMVCRVLQIEEENLSSEKIVIHAMEDIFGVANVITEYSDPEDNAIASPSYVLSPFTHQKVIEAPYVFSEEFKVVPFACRETDRDLGFDVNISVDGGASYLLIDKVANLQPFGTLVAEYSTDTYSIDEEFGFEIDFVAGVNSIETETWAEVFSANKNTALLGEEAISFRSIVPVSGDRYKLTDVIRGRFGTQKESHAPGEEFYFVSKNVSLVSHPEILPGASRKFKYVPYNIKFSGDISEAVALDLDVEGESKKPYIPVNFNANGGSFAARYSTDVVLTWSPRYRGKGAGIGTPGTVLADTNREGLFEIEVWVLGSKVRTTSAIDAVTWVYLEADNILDNGGLANEILFKLFNYRTENGVLFKSDYIEVVCKKS